MTQITKQATDEETALTDTQMDQIWRVVDYDESGFVALEELPLIIHAYEIWNYEKNQKRLLEEIYTV